MMEMIWRVLPKRRHRAAGTARVPVLVSHWDVSETPLSALSIVPPLPSSRGKCSGGGPKNYKVLPAIMASGGGKMDRKRMSTGPRQRHTAVFLSSFGLNHSCCSSLMIIKTQKYMSLVFQGNRDSVDLQSCRWTSLCFNLFLGCLQHLQVTREELGNPSAASSWTADTLWTFMEPNTHLLALVCIQWADPGRTGAFCDYTSFD